MSSEQAGEWRNFHFYSILLDDFSKELELPVPFVNRCISKRRSGTAILQGASGETWRVELTGEGSGRSRTWFFRDGWDSFARENSLKEFDFLLFKYEGLLRFRVSVFDKDACERRGSSVQSSSNAHGSSLESCFRGLQQCSRLKRKVLDPPSSELDVESDSSREKGKAWEAANSFTSKFPFFRKRIKRWYGDISPAILVVPGSFPMVHLPQEDSVFAFHLPEGEGNTSWEVTYCSRPTKRFFCRGWRLFACKNNLGEGDVCVFELVGGLEMQVHIFRSADLPKAVPVPKKVLRS